MRIYAEFVSAWSVLERDCAFRAGDSALGDDRAKHPTDDITLRFVAGEIDVDRLSRDDIFDIAFLLLTAGLDRVSDSLAGCHAFPATHTGHRGQLADDPPSRGTRAWRELPITLRQCHRQMSEYTLEPAHEELE